MVDVSIVIPAFNEENYIANTLESIIDQGYSSKEIIVLANGCNDDTAELARKFTPKVYVSSEKGISRAKNLGYLRAEGDVIVFLDADSTMKPNLLLDIYHSIESNFVGGKVRVYPDDDSFGAKAYFAYVDACSKLSQFLMNINPSLTNGAGACLFAQKEILKKLIKKDGYLFDERLVTMEDVNLISRLRALGSFDYLNSNGVITSTRRFRKSGYLNRFFMDWVEYSNPAQIESRDNIR